MRLNTASVYAKYLTDYMISQAPFAATSCTADQQRMRWVRYKSSNLTVCQLVKYEPAFHISLSSIVGLVHEIRKLSG
jgi:hypothetical protein